MIPAPRHPADAQPSDAAPPPYFSVLIGRASTEDVRRILEVLDALRLQDCREPYEVIVVDRCDDALSRIVDESYPEVHLLRCRADLSLPQMRALALQAARAPHVIVTEDHCVPATGWLQQFARLIREYPRAVAIGGCVENGLTQNTLDWATYLCEYASAASPFAEGPCTELTGVNVAYTRRVLSALPAQQLEQGFWELTVHPLLNSRGDLLIVSDTPVVYHRKRFSLRHFLRQRLAYSRYFAGARFGRRRLARALAAVSSPALPVLFAARLMREMRTRRRFKGPALRAAPYLALFFLAAAAGELIGYVSGPGTALGTLE